MADCSVIAKEVIDYNDWKVNYIDGLLYKIITIDHDYIGWNYEFKNFPSEATYIYNDENWVEFSSVDKFSDGWSIDGYFSDCYVFEGHVDKKTILKAMYNIRLDNIKLHGGTKCVKCFCGGVGIAKDGKHLIKCPDCNGTSFYPIKTVPLSKIEVENWDKLMLLDVIEGKIINTPVPTWEWENEEEET